MRKGVKVAAWVAVFLACAGVGAYVAAHTDPFPPGVDRPGATAPPVRRLALHLAAARRVGGERQERDLPRAIRGRSVHHEVAWQASIHRGCPR